MMSFFLWLFSQHKERERASILHDGVLFLLVWIAAVLVCCVLSQLFDDNNPFAVPVFILAVALIARFTQGYVWGVAASVLGVFCVNFMFTYPYWEFDMSISGYPLTFAAMLIVSVCISTLTTRIKQQEQLRLEVEVEKMRANLLRSVSHDLRTPLASIVGASSVLLEDENLRPDQRTELLQSIRRDARWLNRVTENILSITRFSGGVQLRKVDEVVEEIVSSTIVKFRKQHAALPVIVHRPEEILLAPMDATLIEQVLLNLLDNAAEHGRKTSRIEITLFRQGDRVCLQVSDDGVGFSKAALVHTFDGTLAANGDARRNMGIGLSGCASIVRAHGGALSARNNSTGGACVEFWLPAAEEDKYANVQE